MKSREIKWLAFLLLIWLVFPATAWAQDVELPAEKENAGAVVNDNALTEEPAPENSITTENAALNTSMTNSEFEQKLSQWQSKYPNGSTYDEEFGNATGLAWECHGYARFLTQHVFGVECMNGKAPGWVQHRDISQLAPGDLVRYSNNNHTVFVTAVSGENVTITDANVPYGTNRVRWGIQTTKSHLNATLTYIAHYNANPVVSTPADTTPPVIQRIWLDPQSGTGRMMYIEVSDNVDISEVWCPTWAPGETEPFSKFATREPGTNIWKCAIMGDDHGLKQGSYRTDVYAFDSARNKTGTSYTYNLDWEEPKISNIKVKDVSTLGYTVECTVSDNIDIDRVQFPTWLVNKTTPAGDWPTNSFYSGSIQGNTVTYTVRDWDYNHVKGDYATHIYVYDKSGNSSRAEAPVTRVANEGKTVKEVSFNNHRYLLLNDALYWAEAKKAAENMGGHLVTITSSEEQSVVKNLISEAGRPAYFIGGTDEGTEGNFRWVTGESMTYTNWHGSNPDNWDGNENYMDMLAGGLWNDIPGNYPCGYIVEIDPVISEVSCSYQTHVQNEGLQDWKTNGATSGTSGKSLRLEGIKIKLNTNSSELGLSYATHVENIGWQDPVSAGEMSGTFGKSLRLEAIKINLTGTKASQYDVYYRVHAQNIGWLGWAKNGESSGTAGFAYRLEAIEIRVVPKGSAAPGSTENAFQDKSNIENILNKMVGTWTYTKNSWTEENIITKLDWNKGHMEICDFTAHKGDSMEFDFYIYEADNDGKAILYIDKNSLKSYGISPTSFEIAVDTLMNQPSKIKLDGAYFERK